MTETPSLSLGLVLFQNLPMLDIRMRSFQKSTLVSKNKPGRPLFIAWGPRGELFKHNSQMVVSQNRRISR